MVNKFTISIPGSLTAGCSGRSRFPKTQSRSISPLELQLFRPATLTSKTITTWSTRCWMARKWTRKSRGIFAGATRWAARKSVTYKTASREISRRTSLKSLGQARLIQRPLCRILLQLQSMNSPCLRTSVTECSSPNLTGGLLICDRQQTDTFLNVDNRWDEKAALSQACAFDSPSVSCMLPPARPYIRAHVPTIPYFNARKRCSEVGSTLVNSCHVSTLHRVLRSGELTLRMMA